MPHPRFRRTIGIDYSGADTAEAALKGLRVYQTLGDGPVEEVLPPQGRSRYWTRRSIAAWLIEILDGATPTIVGIDHGFSFPLAYFDRHGLLGLRQRRRRPARLVEPDLGLTGAARRGRIRPRPAACSRSGSRSRNHSHTASAPPADHSR